VGRVGKLYGQAGSSKTGRQLASLTAPRPRQNCLSQIVSVLFLTQLHLAFCIVRLLIRALLPPLGPGASLSESCPWKALGHAFRTRRPLLGFFCYWACRDTQSGFFQNFPAFLQSANQICVKKTRLALSLVFVVCSLPPAAS
jgi:hypothetical protein